jgi:hypothetical protein
MRFGGSVSSEGVCSNAAVIIATAILTQARNRRPGWRHESLIQEANPRSALALTLVTAISLATALGGCGSGSEHRRNLDGEEAAQLVIERLRPSSHEDGSRGLGCSVPGFDEAAEAWIVLCRVWSGSEPGEFQTWHVAGSTGELTLVATKEATR